MHKENLSDNRSHHQSFEGEGAGIDSGFLPEEGSILKLLAPSDPCLENIKELIRHNKITLDVMGWSLTSSYTNFFSDDITALVLKGRFSLERALGEHVDNSYRMMRNPWLQKLLTGGFIDQNEMVTLGATIQQMSAQERDMRWRSESTHYTTEKLQYTFEFSHTLNELPLVQTKLVEIFTHQPSAIEHFIFDKTYFGAQSPYQEADLLTQLILAENDALHAIVAHYIFSSTAWFNRLFGQLNSQDLYARARQTINTRIQASNTRHEEPRYGHFFPSTATDFRHDKRIKQLFVPEDPAEAYLELLLLFESQRAILILTPYVLSLKPTQHILLNFYAPAEQITLTCFNQFSISNTVFSYRVEEKQEISLSQADDTTMQLPLIPITITQFEYMSRNPLLDKFIDKRLDPSALKTFLMVNQDYIAYVTNHSFLTTLIIEGKFTAQHVDALNKTPHSWDWFIESGQAIHWIAQGILQPEHILHTGMLYRMEYLNKFEKMVSDGLIKCDYFQYLDPFAIKHLTYNEDVLREGFFTAEHYMPMRNNRLYVIELFNEHSINLLKSNIISPEVLCWTSKMNRRVLTSRVLALNQRKILCLTSLSRIDPNYACLLLNNDWVLSLLEHRALTQPDLYLILSDLNLYERIHTTYTLSLNQLPMIERLLADIFDCYPHAIAGFIKSVDSVIDLLSARHKGLRDSVSAFLLDNHEWFTKFFSDMSAFNEYWRLQSCINNSADLRSGLRHVFQHHTHFEAKQALTRLKDTKHIGSIYSLFKKRFPEDVRMLIAKHSFSEACTLTADEKQAMVYRVFSGLAERSRIINPISQQPNLL